MKSLRFLSLLCVGTLSAGALVAGAAVSPPQAQAASSVRITPNPAIASDPFEGWGTSLVWFANATGGYPTEVRQKLFDAVFGEDGLNLNIARYNIGGGNATDVPSYLRPGGAVPGWWNPDLGESDDQGEITSNYADRDRYAAAWDGENPDHYNWDADQGQRWWLDALKDKITHWEAFSNSPPYFLTQSGYVSGGINNATSEQLAPEDMAAFSSYLVNVVEELEKAHGITFDTLDPFNEPNTDYWQTRIPNGATWPTSASRQEGAHIGPTRQDQMIKALAARLAEPGTTTDVSISAMDETNPSKFVQNWNGWSAESKGLVDQLNVHTYGTGDRLIVRDIAKASDKPLWMSEVEGDWNGGSGFNQTNIDNGIGMATRIVDDLRELEPTAWVFWQPVEDLYNMEKVEKLNWGSVFIDFDCNADGNSERRIADGDADPSCQVLTNSKFNTVRNFTHYIEPGDRLIPTDDTQTTAALTAEGDGVTLVHINSEASERTVQVDLSRFANIAPGATVTPIVTTESSAGDVTDHALVTGTAIPVDAASKSATVTLPAKSVTTLVVSGVSGVAADAAVFEDGETYQLFGVQSGKALAADPNGLAIRTGATTADAAPAQAWTVHSISGEGTNRHRIALQAGDGRFLAVNGTSTTLVSADAAAAASDPALQWIPSTTDGRTYSLLSASAERVLDVNGQGTADGTTVGTWTSNNGGNQRWTIASTRVTSVVPVTAATAVGEQPELPATVTLNYRGGVQRTASVAWDLTGVDFSAAGTVQVPGSGTDVFGAGFEVAATVEIGAYTATRPVSITTYAGATRDRVVAAAPTTVPAEVRLGGTAYDAAVTWDFSGVGDADFAQPGTVTVPGAITVPGGATIEARLSVIVTAPGTRNVAGDSKASATFTESPSYSVDRTKNGITTDKGWSNWRSGTKNTQDTLTYVLSSTQQVSNVKVYFYRDGTASWAQSLRVEHRTAGGDWIAGEDIAVPVPDSGAPTVEVPLGGVVADEVRVVMQARENTHMIVSEVEINALAASPSNVTDLARVTVGDALLDGLDPARETYAIDTNGAAWPTIGAVAVDDEAAVEIVQPADAGGAGSITVTAVDGTSRTVTITVTRHAVVGAVSLGGAAEVGATLTAQVEEGDPADAVLAYAWTRDGQPIESATAAAYTATEADLGHELRAVVTASADGFASGTATSAAVVVVAAPGNPGNPGGPGGPGTPGEPGNPGEPGTGGAAAPAESALTDATRGGITAPSVVTAGSSITIGVGASRAGSSVDAWLFSTPVHLGTKVVSAAGEITVSIPVDAPTGQHRLVVTDASGAVIGWVPLEVRAASGPLAVTGLDLGPTLPFALGALLLGSLLVGVTTRRRSAAE